MGVATGFSSGLLAVGLTIYLGGCSTIQGAIEGAKSEFYALDRNDDGVISAQEAAKDPALAKSFARADINQDGNINRREYDAAHAMISDLDFNRLDFNQDGVISQREVKASRPSLRSKFKIVDSDDDGNISKSEYRAATINLLADTPFASADEDGDGVIDRREARLVDAIQVAFSEIDIDDDGLISRTEYKRAQSR